MKKDHILQWLSKIPTLAPLLGTKALTAPITEAEITAAINKLHRRKSTGPDRIPNEWYKDYQAEITPILARVYNETIKTG